MAKLHMKVGKNIGKVLLEIAQEAILAGDFDRAFETYTLSFDGMTKEHAMDLLKNKYVLVAEDDGVTVNMTDDEFTNLMNGISIEYGSNDATVKLNGEVVHSFVCNGSIPDKCMAKSLTDFITFNPYYVSVVCEIPKGTVYLTNKSKDIASRKLIIKGVLCEHIWDVEEE